MSRTRMWDTKIRSATQITAQHMEGRKGNTQYGKGKSDKVNKMRSHTMGQWKCRITSVNKLTRKVIPKDMAKIRMTRHEGTPGDKETRQVSKQVAISCLTMGITKRNSRTGQHTPGHVTLARIHSKCNEVSWEDCLAATTPTKLPVTDGSTPGSYLPTPSQPIRQPRTISSRAPTALSPKPADNRSTASP